MTAEGLDERAAGVMERIRSVYLLLESRAQELVECHRDLEQYAARLAQHAECLKSLDAEWQHKRQLQEERLTQLAARLDQREVELAQRAAELAKRANALAAKEMAVSSAVLRAEPIGTTSRPEATMAVPDAGAADDAVPAQAAAASPPPPKAQAATPPPIEVAPSPAEPAPPPLAPRRAARPALDETGPMTALLEKWLGRDDGANLGRRILLAELRKELNDLAACAGLHVKALSDSRRFSRCAAGLFDSVRTRFAVEAERSGNRVHVVFNPLGLVSSRA